MLHIAASRSLSESLAAIWPYEWSCGPSPSRREYSLPFLRLLVWKTLHTQVCFIWNGGLKIWQHGRCQHISMPFAAPWVCRLTNRCWCSADWLWFWSSPSSGSVGTCPCQGLSLLLASVSTANLSHLGFPKNFDLASPVLRRQWKHALTPIRSGHCTRLLVDFSSEPGIDW